MQDKIKQLKELIRTVPLRRVVVEEDINTIYQLEGQAGILNVIKNAEPVFEEVKEIAILNVALPFNAANENWNNQELIRKEITLHCLRHSIATHLIDNGANIEFVQQLLGHAEIDTAHLYSKRRKQQMKILSQIR